jgi:hypothetical protein
MKNMKWKTSLSSMMKANEYYAYRLLQKLMNVKSTVMNRDKWTLRFSSRKETNVNDDVYHENKINGLVWYNGWKLNNIDWQ